VHGMGLREYESGREYESEYESECEKMTVGMRV
jgi:hypothetical protein